MQLTKEEFCLFNINSQQKFLKEDGLFIRQKKLNTQYSLAFYKLYNFYVELLMDSKAKKVIRIAPVINYSALS